MKLLADWKSILTKAWSVRFIILAGLLSGIEVALQIIEPTVSATMPKGVFASLSGLATAAALVARVIAQNGVENGDAKK